MSHISIINRTNGLKKTFQLLEPSKYLTDEGITFCSDNAWDGMLHFIPCRGVDKNISITYKVLGRVGDARTINDVLKSAGRIFIAEQVIIKDAHNKTLCSCSPCEVPDNLRKLKYSSVYKISNKYYFKVGE